MARALLWLIAGAAVALAPPAWSQQQTPGSSLDRGTVVSPVLTIDSERLFRQSAFGKRVSAEAEADVRALEAENERIAADLEAEEKALTERRASLSPEKFRALADAFDEKVLRTRSERAARGRAISEGLEEAREVFLAAAGPVLEQLMRDAGAAVILEQRSVFVSLSAVEITDDAIALIDENLGSGEDKP